jgi:hypothetical protein
MKSEVKVALNEIDKAREILNRYSDNWVLAFDIQHDDLKQNTSFMWQEGNFNAVVGLMVRSLVSCTNDIVLGTAKLDEEEED